jgi:hypothetical protein
MTTLIVGRNSSIGVSLFESQLLSDLIMIDRNKLCEVLFSKEKLKIFLEIENITDIIYLMVDRDVDPIISEKRSKINYSHPIKLWQGLEGIPGASFIWVNSIFAQDENLLSKHPYLRIQNMAHEAIVECHTPESATYSRISFSQIYGSKEFVRHQPFLYNLNTLISKGQDVQLINGKKTNRNFVNVSDVCRVLADFRNWRTYPNVACIANGSFSWWEIAESFKEYYKSDSVITDSKNEGLLEDRNYTTRGLEDMSSTYVLKDIRSVILEGAFS